MLNPNLSDVSFGINENPEFEQNEFTPRARIEIKVHNTEENSFPLLFHDIWSADLIENSYSDWYLKLRDIFFAQNKLPNLDHHDLTVITWNNSSRVGDFEHSLGIAGGTCTILGKEKRIFLKSEKIRETAEALKKIKSKYVLAADSFDVIAIADPTTILNSFLDNFKCKALFNATVNHFPVETPTKKFETSVTNSRCKFLNSGIFIGETKFLAQLFNEAQSIDRVLPDDDQGVLKLLYQAYYPEIQIDSGCKIIQPIKVLKGLENEILRIC